MLDAVPRLPAASAPACEGVDAAGGEVDEGAGPGFRIDAGIAEEGVAGMVAEGSPELRLPLRRMPVRVGLRSSVRALLARLPFLKPTLSVMRVMLLRIADAALSRIRRRVLDAVPRLPAASATRAVKEWTRLVARLDEGVKDQVLALTVALPRKALPE